MYDDTFSYECCSLEDISLLKNIGLLTYRLMAFIIFPPLFINGILIKGLYFSPCVDILNELYPDLHLYFYSIASSMWFSFPKAKGADAYFSLYNNKLRENYFRKTFPEKNNIELIPLQEADYTNEKHFKPNIFTKYKKNIDLLMISRLDKIKNLDIFFQALKIYRKKYNKYLNAAIVDNTSDFSDYKHDIENKYKQYSDYVKFLPPVPINKVREYYWRSRIYIFTSLIEGSNRSIKEAVLSDVPVIAFSDYNKEIRGETPIFPDKKIGRLVNNFSAVELADEIDYMINHLNEYSPRKSYIKYMNRIIFADICLKKFAIYRENIYKGKYNSILENKEILKAIKSQYKISYEDFLYDKVPKYTKTVFYKNSFPLFEAYMQKYEKFVR